MATRQREKALKRQQEKDMRPKAIVKHVRISSSKVKIVLDLIRGKSVEEALCDFNAYAQSGQRSGDEADQISSCEC